VSETVRDFGAVRLLVCAGDGPPLSKESDANMFIGAAWSQGAAGIVIPVERLSDEFFRLGTRLAGEVVQKFANYGLRLVIVGDIAERIAKSEPLRDFVFESNRGHIAWFVEDMDELARRLARLSRPAT
jgi:hypothetical protein